MSKRTKVIDTRLKPIHLMSEEKVEQIARAISNRNQMMMDAYAVLAATLSRIDEAAQLAVKLPSQTFKERLILHSGKLSKDAQDFKNILIQDAVTIRESEEYRNYITSVVSEYQDRIEAVLENKDNGKKLRELTGTFDINRSFQEIVRKANTNPGIGRPADKETDYLYEMAEKLVYGQGLTWKDAAKKLIETLSSQADYLTDVQRNALQRLKYSSDSGDMFKQAYHRRKAARD